MAYTSLSIIGTPGKPHSFLAKTAAAGAGPHTGLFTELSVTALPGPRHSFTAKTAAGAASGPHTGLFTALSVMGLPGGRHTFTAKSVAEAAEHGGSQFPKRPFLRLQPYVDHDREICLQDDQDLLDILQMLGPTGVLN